MNSNATRGLVALGAIVLVVVAFFVLRGDEEAGEGSSVDSSSTTATTADGGSTTEDKPADQGKPAKDEAPDEPELTTIVIKDGVPEGGVAELEFAKGDEVRFAVVADAANELHIHGYDLYEDLPAGKKVEIAFPAELDGIYEIESHTTGELIAELRVS